MLLVFYRCLLIQKIPHVDSKLAVHLCILNYLLLLRTVCIVLLDVQYDADEAYHVVCSRNEPNITLITGQTPS